MAPVHLRPLSVVQLPPIPVTTSVAGILVSGGSASASATPRRSVTSTSGADMTHLVTDSAALRAHLAAFAEALSKDSPDVVLQRLLPARRKALGALGFKTANVKAMDSRSIHSLSNVGQLYRERQLESKVQRQLQSKNNQDQTHELAPGWTMHQARALAMKKKVTGNELAAFETEFITRLEEAGKHAEAEEALREIGRADPEGLKKLSERKLLLNRRAERRRQRMDALGIFTEEVNAVRASATLRVELRRFLNTGDFVTLRSKKKEAEADPRASLEARLQSLVADLEALEKEDAPMKQDADIERYLAAEAAAAASGKRAKVPTLAKQEAAAAARLEMLRGRCGDAVVDRIGKYRTRVEGERQRLIRHADEEAAKATAAALAADAAAAEKRRMEAARKYEEAGGNSVAAKANARAAAAKASLEEARDLRRQGEIAAKEREREEELRAVREAEIAAQLEAARIQRQGEERDTTRKAAALEAIIGAPVVHTATTFYPIPEPPEDEASQAIREIEPEETPAPELPPVEAETMGRPLADILQQRLERVWELLRMPVMQKLNMVLKYTDRDNAHMLEMAIEAYEYAAASLQLEEALIDEWNRALGYGDSTGRVDPSLPAPRSVGELEVAVASVRVHIAEAKARLMDDLGDVLTVDGNPI